MPEHPISGSQQSTSHKESLVQQDIVISAVNGSVDHGDSAPPSGRRVPTLTMKCSGCDNDIAFQPPVAGEPVAVWLCKTCGAVYYGDDAASAAANAFGVVRAAQMKSNSYLADVSPAIDARLHSIPPEYVQRLVSSLAGEAYSGQERRYDKRYQMAVPVVAVPLGPDFRVSGEPLRMTTINVSLSGASLMHTRFTEAPYFALDFTAAGVEYIQVLLEVLRVRSYGPVYEVAGQFINRLSQTPPSSKDAVR